ncbi:MAG TPA: SAM-dependent methyltransferase, partial [Flavobacteriaceae bacterium]|nr:SAM-dependent methyltransferase [Flavobacteriaceae bacterium]
RRSSDLSTRHLSILEMGFGTGLNALLTLLYLQDDLQEQFEFENKNISFSVNYDALEAFPLTPDHYQTLDYPKHLNSPDALFRKLHEVPWDLPNEISKGFTLFKQNRHFEDFVADQAYDLVYYDAFGARVQPELWEIERFLALYKALRPHGVLVTYAAKGSVRRALQEVGFMVERLPGPPGKREMLRGTKI